MLANLPDEFEFVSSKKWKQQIQYELKGADYNETLIWESPEGIKVKPFYHCDENNIKYRIETNKEPFAIVQNIYVHDVVKSNKRALDSINRGAESICFTLENDNLELGALMQELPTKGCTYFFNLPNISIDLVKKINNFSLETKAHCSIKVDPIGQLLKDGNWFENLEKDFAKLNSISEIASIPFISVNAGIIQNAGANMTQQLAYTLAHINEYFNRIKMINQPITIEVAIGSNYFFEIAKIRALRIVFKALAKEYNHDYDCHIVATPTKRNKTIYDYNINMLRTTTECMSAILGGANSIANTAYDALYHKDNEFGDRISRNQLLILKHESYFDKVMNVADGTYYIESLTEQLAEKSLALFKEIEEKGGLITELIEGTIQKKIVESARKEQELFDNGNEILLGTNKYPNKNDKMKNDLELFPFVKQNPRKTLITPVIEKRLAEKLEQARLSQEI